MNQHIQNPPYDLLNQILDSLDSGYWIWSIAENEMFLSPGFKAMLGFEENDIDSTPEAWQKLVVKEDLPVLLDNFEQHILMKAKKPFHNRTRLYHRLGHIVEVICSGQIIKWSSNGQPLLAIGSHKDITSIQTIQKSDLQRRLSQLDVVFSLLNEMIFLVKEPDNIVEDINPSVSLKLGYSKNELIGKNCDIVRATDEEIARSKLLHLPTGFIVLKTKQGKLIPCSVSRQKYEYKGINRIVKVVIDQSEMYTIYNQWIDQEKMFRQLAERSLDIVSIADENHLFEYISPSATEVLGFEPEYFLGKSVFDFVDESSYEVVTGTIMRSNEIGQTEFEMLANWRKKNGEFAVMRTRVINYEKYNKTTHKMDRKSFAYSRDLTEEYRTAAREKELQSLKGDFISTASHQLRTPVAVFQTNVDLIQHHLNKENPDLNKVKVNVERLAKEAKRMTNLTRDLLMFSKASSNDFKPNFENVKLKQFLEEWIENYGLDQAKRLLYIGDDSKVISSDPTLLTHILNNIIDNAIKYSVGSELPKITVNTTPVNPIIVITDYGIGIPKKDQEKIMRSFIRGSNVKDFQGTGIGLAIAKRMCQLLNITLSFESEENKGTTFIITLTQPK